MADQESSPATGTTNQASSKPPPMDAPQKLVPEMSNSENPTSSDHLPVSSNKELLHIPPPQRKLGIHQNKINQPVSHLGDMDSVDFQLRKLVGLTIQSTKNNPKFTAEVLDEITDLTRQYMHSLFDSLHKLTEVQRHRIPGISDLDMCLLTHNISPTDLYQEYQRTNALNHKTKASAQTIKAQLNHILREYNAEHYNLDKEDPSLVFHANEQYGIAALVPRQNRPRDYIPEYFPDLPPDFTYTSTGDYMQTISELKEIKVKLADESRLNEVSLYKLIDDDDARWNSAFEQALEASESSESDNEEIMSLSGEKEMMSDVETPLHEVEVKNSANEADPSRVQATESSGDPAVAEKSKNRFDFVAYAKKRRLAKERYAVEIQRRRNLREKNIFMKAETMFSSSAKKVASMEDKKYFEDELESRFKKVIKATRKAETTKMASLKAMLEKKRLAEKEKEQSNGVYEFGFNFDAKTNLSDDSEDEMQDLGFGDKPIVFEEDKESEKASIKFNFGDEAELNADSDSNAELADLEAELEAEGADLEADLASVSHTDHGAAPGPLKADSLSLASSTKMQENSEDVGGDQPMNIDSTMWGSDMDSDELQDLE